MISCVPPGSGETRLVRAIPGALSRRKGEAAELMYTADKRALESDEISVDFITGSHVRGGCVSGVVRRT